jgi:hypothetical protein
MVPVITVGYRSAFSSLRAQGAAWMLPSTPVGLFGFGT